MSNAIERLAAEMMKLSDDEWTQLVERRLAGQDSAVAFGPAWDEISERLADRELTQEAASDQGQEEPKPGRESSIEILSRGKA